MEKENKIIDCIQRYSNKFPSDKSIPLRDDTSFFYPSQISKKYVLLTTDQLVEKVHFNWDWCLPEDVAFKLVQMNLSDIYAKGGIPQMALLNLYLSDSFLKHKKWLSRFSKTFGEELKKYNIRLLGGDTTTAPFDCFSMTLLGRSDQFIFRENKNIKKGDILLLLGNVGGGSYALWKFQNKKNISKKLHSFYTRPKAQADAPKILIDLNAKSSIDLSDSLHKSLSILAKLNHIRCKVFLTELPYPIELNDLEFSERLKHILFGGEDFAILFICSPKEKLKIDRLHRKNISIKIIGYIQERNKNASVQYMKDNKKINIKEMMKNEFKHFS